MGRYPLTPPHPHHLPLPPAAYARHDPKAAKLEKLAGLLPPRQRKQKKAAVGVSSGAAAAKRRIRAWGGGGGAAPRASSSPTLPPPLCRHRLGPPRVGGGRAPTAGRVTLGPTWSTRDAAVDGGGVIGD